MNEAQAYNKFFHLHFFCAIYKKSKERVDQEDHAKVKEISQKSIKAYNLASFKLDKVK